MKRRIQVGVRHPTIRRVLTQMLEAALEAVDPSTAVRRALQGRGRTLQIGATRYDLQKFQRVVAIGAGKASAPMAQALESRLGARLDSGLVVVKYGHAAPTRAIQILEAGHPVPDNAGQAAASGILALLRELGPRDLVFVLLSGGASSLLPAPATGLTLADKQDTTQLLLRCGATIQEINTVRKHLSAAKGGQLAAATSAQVVSLILSDVIGDDLGTIGSGPTAPDPTTFADTRDILDRYKIWEALPPRAQAHVDAGLRGTTSETPKPAAAVFRRVQNHLIGNNQAAVEAAARAARRAGFHPLILSTSITGEAKEIAKMYGAVAREIRRCGRPVRRPACVIGGGETTVTVRGDGKGGRAQEFALAASIEIAGLPDLWIAGFGTDGTDGPTDSAGAVVSAETASPGSQAGADARAALLRHDAYPFLTRLNAHIRTGPTGTNVNDLYLLLAL